MEEIKKCKMCDFTLDYTERELPCDAEWYPESEKWHVRLMDDGDKDYYDILVDYDCGYASTSTGPINYCPICGRKLDGRD